MKIFSKNLMAAVLVILLVGAGIQMIPHVWGQKKSLSAKGAQSPVLEKVTFKVDGMSCAGCALSIKTTLEEQKGVRKADVLFEKGQATAEIEKSQVKPEDLAAAINKIGYKATVLSAQ